MMNQQDTSTDVLDSIGTIESIDKIEVQKVDIRKSGSIASGADQFQGYKNTSPAEDQDNRFDKSNFRKDSIRTESFTQVQSYEDELYQAAENLDQFGDLCDAIDEFEQQAYTTKRDINQMDRQSQHFTILPHTVKLCYSLMKQYIQQLDKSNFDQKGEMEKQIISTVKEALDINKVYGKFKGEFFVINEPIINKDTNILKITTVKQQRNQLQTILDKKPEIESSIVFVNNNLQNLKSNYDQFEQLQFQDKFEENERIKEVVDQNMKEVEEICSRVMTSLRDAKQQIKNFPQTKEQRNRLMEIKNKISSVERRHHKIEVFVQNHLEQCRMMNNTQQTCKQIIDSLQPQKLFNMIEQTKKIEKFIDFHKTILKFQTKLAQLLLDMQQLDKDVSLIDQQIQDYHKTITGDIEGEFEEVIAKIKDLSENIANQIFEENQRLDNFDSRIMDVNISEGDQQYLNKEITKFRNALIAIESTNDIHRQRAEQLEGQMLDLNDKSEIVNVEELKQLKTNLKQLTKLSDTDIPKVRKNIDSLDSFVMKSLKNQLNDGNKKSQAFISKIKKSYEDLQRQIDGLIQKYNGCVNQLQQLNDNFENNDMERFNEFQQLNERLKEEELLIVGGSGTSGGSGETDASATDTIDPQSARSPLKIYDEDGDGSLNGVKKNIIGNINKLVNQFNENNKVIKDSNKAIKSENVLSDLVIRNKDIKRQCESINDKIEGGKQTAAEIRNRLDELMNQTVIDNLTNKYNGKNQKIQDIENLKNKTCKELLKSQENIDKIIRTADDLTKRLDLMNPINNPGSSSSNENFKDLVTKNLNQVGDIKDEAEAMKEQFQEINQLILDTIEPLQDLDNREVSPEEIDQIKENIKEQIDEMRELQDNIPTMEEEVQTVKKSVNDLIDNELSRKLEGAHTLIQNIMDIEAECDQIKNQNLKKLKYQKDNLDKIKKKQGKEDPQLCSSLEDLIKENQNIDGIMDDADNKLRELKKKRSETKKVLDEIIKTPTKYTPAQIDNYLTNLDEIEDRYQNQLDKIKGSEKDIELLVLNLEQLLNTNESKKEILQDIRELEHDADDDLMNLKELLDKLPQQIKHFRDTLMQMKEGTEGPHADYEEKKQLILETSAELEEVEQQIEETLKGKYPELLENKEQLKMNIKKAQNNGIDSLKQVLDRLNHHKNEVTNVFNDTLDAREQLNDLKKDLGDCEIATTLAKRKNEFQLFSSRLDRLNKEMKNLKQANKKRDDNGDNSINKLMKESEFKLKILEREKQDLLKLQQKEIDEINVEDLDDFSKNCVAIKKIRNFKHKIQDSDSKLNDIDDTTKEIMKKLMEQDMENSVDLLGSQAVNLEERLQVAQRQLKKINEAGEEMDGNTSNDEEHEFIYALKNEMPNVFENIDSTFILLKDIDRLVAIVKQTLSPDKMKELTDNVAVATENVEESEGLVQKLEKEILEWNALKKLCRRDEQLEDINIQCSDLMEDLYQEKQNTEIELEKNLEKQSENRDQDMVDKDGKKVDIMSDLIRLEGQMQNYIQEIDELLEEIQKIEMTKEVCLDEFTNRIPNGVKAMRAKRNAHNQKMKEASKALKRPAQLFRKSSKMSETETEEDENDMDIYTMILINCKFKPQILKMLEELKNMNKKRRDLEDNYSQMRKEVFKIKQIKLYKPVRGDVVDEMFAGYLNKAKLTIDVQRISASNYLFGSKKILAKIMNGKLVIRVGGGYMSAEEFIEQYGKIEMMKMMKQEESKNQEIQMNASAKITMQRKSNIADQEGFQNDIREKMRKSLMNIKPYDNKQTKESPSLSNTAKSRIPFSRRPEKDKEATEQQLQSALMGLKLGFQKKLTTFEAKQNQGRSTFNPAQKNLLVTPRTNKKTKDFGSSSRQGSTSPNVTPNSQNKERSSVTIETNTNILQKSIGRGALGSSKNQPNSGNPLQRTLTGFGRGKNIKSSLGNTSPRGTHTAKGPDRKIGMTKKQQD